MGTAKDPGGSIGLRFMCPRVGWLMIAVILGVSVSAGAQSYDRIITKKMADQLFGLKKSEWDRKAIEVFPRNWKFKIVSPPGVDTGGIIYAEDSAARRLIEIIPFFWDANLPTSFVMVTFYSPLNSVLIDGKLKAEFTRQVVRSLGTAYSVEVQFSQADKMDIVQFTIKRKTVSDEQK